MDQKTAPGKAFSFNAPFPATHFRPSAWNFTIHTLGLGVTSLDSEYNLTAIAKAHGGTYRRVDVPTAARR